MFFVLTATALRDRFPINLSSEPRHVIRKPLKSSRRQRFAAFGAHYAARLLRYTADAAWRGTRRFHRAFGEQGADFHFFDRSSFGGCFLSVNRRHGPLPGRLLRQCICKRDGATLLRVSFSLIDTFGQKSDSTPVFFIDAAADGPPSIRFIKPAMNKELSPALAETSASKLGMI